MLLGWCWLPKSLIEYAMKKMTIQATTQVCICSQKLKYNHLHGLIPRESESIVQDPHTGALTELFCTSTTCLHVVCEPILETGNSIDYESN
jgi:hypothetical protein